MAWWYSLVDIDPLLVEKFCDITADHRVSCNTPKFGVRDLGRHALIQSYITCINSTIHNTTPKDPKLLHTQVIALETIHNSNISYYNPNVLTRISYYQSWPLHEVMQTILVHKSYYYSWNLSNLLLHWPFWTGLPQGWIFHFHFS